MNNLQEAAHDINKAIGKLIAFTGADKEEQKVEALPTGILPLDTVIGIGGLPKGRIIEIHGLQSSGKTSLCMQIISQYQKRGLNCAYVDAEYSFNFDHAHTFGVDTDNLLLLQPDCGEEAFEAMEQLVRNKTAQVIVVDSVPALVPRPEAEAEIGKPTMGGQARLMAQGLRKLIGPINKNGAIIIFINQLRQNIMGGQYDPYTLPGGMALRFYSSVMLELKKDKAIVSGETLLGYEIRVRVKKNKVGTPAGECMIHLMFKDGFSAEADVLEAAEKLEIITRAGNTFYFGETKLGVGLNRVRTFLKDNPEIMAQIQDRLPQ
jgi:recombination protein RecA